MHQLELGDCYYRPSFFNMKIGTLIDLDNLNEIPEATMGLYFHEYVHYLQDISTIYGLMNMSTINYYIQACAHYIANKNNDKVFDVPMTLDKIKPTDGSTDYGVSNFALRKLYMGSPIREKSRKIEDFGYKVSDYEFEPGKNIGRIDIWFRDIDTGSIRYLEFGGTHVCEGMAYILEQEHYSAVLPIAPEYPYSIVQNLAELICPVLLDYKVLLVALCDISLMTYHPGLSYVRLLKFVQESLVIDEEFSFEEFYSACMNHIKGSHVDFAVLSEQVRVQIAKNFNADYYDNILRWVDIVFGRICALRNEIPSFMTDLMRFGEPRKNPLFHQIIKQLGSPLVINEEGYGTFSLPIDYQPTDINFNPGIFMAVGQILKIFAAPSPTPCELKAYCLKSRETDPSLNIDLNCDTAPWKKAIEKNLCPVGQMWHHWALKEFSPRYQ